MPNDYGMKSETFTPDSLIAGDKVITKNGTLLTGENRTRGALLGKITLGAVTETHAGNTGNGVLTPDANTPLLANAQAGVYKAVCIVATENLGTFRVSDPKGNVLGDVVVGNTFANQIKFAIADGTNDFIVGDTFLITVAAGSGKYKLSAAAAIDGSQEPDAILVEATDATAEDIDVGLYVGGEFNENAITFGAGHSADSVRDALRDKGIILKKGIAA